MIGCRLRDKFCDTEVDFEKCTFWIFLFVLLYVYVFRLLRFFFFFTKSLFYWIEIFES